MMRRATLLLVFTLVSMTASAAECVVVLHGLARTANSMDKMTESLRDAGFEAVNIDYPSRDFPIEELVPLSVEKGLSACRAIDDVDTIHFVAHSLGGILLRYYLAENDIAELGRVVMLGPPNQGSAAVDELEDVPGFDWLNGPAGRQLGQGEDSVPLALGPAEFELGIIAGTRSIDPVASAALPDPDDGRVSLEDTKLEGMDDFVAVAHSHAFMMRMQRPIELTIRFLRTGRFSSVDSS